MTMLEPRPSWKAISTKRISGPPCSNPIVTRIACQLVVLQTGYTLRTCVIGLLPLHRLWSPSLGPMPWDRVSRWSLQTVALTWSPCSGASSVLHSLAVEVV